MGYSPWGHRESDTTERLSRDKNQTNILKLSSKKKDENQEKVFKTLALIGMSFCTKTKKKTRMVLSHHMVLSQHFPPHPRCISVVSVLIMLLGQVHGPETQLRSHYPAKQTKAWSLEQRKVYCRAIQEEWLLTPSPSNPEIPKDFCKEFLTHC